MVNTFSIQVIFDGLTRLESKFFCGMYNAFIEMKHRMSYVMKHMFPCNPMYACLLPAKIAKVACINIIAVLTGRLFHIHMVPVSFAY